MTIALSTEGYTKTSGRSTSFFEFWPAWIMYGPVGVQWIILALRYRSLTLPFLANPSLRLSGMVGVGKSELMSQASGRSAQAILPWIELIVDSTAPKAQADDGIRNAAEKGIALPFVCKPDIGCRGVGVKLVKTKAQFIQIIESYPERAKLICQKLASYEPEAGIFYVKDPETGESEIVSLCIKLLPRVVGDGISTLGQLIENDTRAGRLRHQYYNRHKDAWDTIPEEGIAVRLVFSASHSKGAIFTDACQHITPELTRAVTDIMQDLPDFYYGRLDVKYENLDALKAGHNLEIVEINGASAETAHIWDENTKFTDAIKALLWQYRTLFRIGAYHRAKGKKAPSLSDFLRGWKIERALTKHYPLTD